MNKIKIMIIVMVSLSFLELRELGNYSNIPITLKGTNWTSQFFHYCNSYYFETDSSGFSEDGQVAWSCPVDTVALGISGDEILYSNQENFKYKIIDTVLTIEYLTPEPNETPQKKVFYFRPAYADWISEYEYAYGRECLRKGKKKEKFEF